MTPSELATKYDKIALWWQQHHQASDYGVGQLQRALSFVKNSNYALDVGCGAGGRFINTLEQQGYEITGVDVSKSMIALAQHNHPSHQFFHHDICQWHTEQTFDVIVAWDSLFHLPLSQHQPVISKLCRQLNQGGVLMYTFGNAQGEHTDQWHNDTFYYSSIGINNNLALLIDSGMLVVHLELDQYPQNHVYAIAIKQ